jgi:hypothetical protein
LFQRTAASNTDCCKNIIKPRIQYFLETAFSAIMEIEITVKLVPKAAVMWMESGSSQFVVILYHVILRVYRHQTRETFSVTAVEATKTNNRLFAHVVDMFGVNEVLFLAVLTPLS